MGSSNNGECFIHLVAFTLDDLSDGDVDELEVAPGVHHEVLWLDVPADDKIVVQVLNYHYHTGSVKLAVLCGEQPDLLHHIIEIFPSDIFTNDEQVVFCLKSLAHLDKKWVANTV